MSGLEDHKSGKAAEDENFPVASLLIDRTQRPVMKAFYRFARSADDAADHPKMSPKDKHDRLNQLEKTLLGHSDNAADALPLRKILFDRGLTTQHPLDLLVAFRQDINKNRYETWEDLLHYCSFSANPVGRFILQIHGEKQSLYPESDVICTTLQVINHLQDCKKDYLELDRIYLPLEEFYSEGIQVNELGREAASLSLKNVFAKVIKKTRSLKPDLECLTYKVQNKRLSLEISVISNLAKRLLNLLSKRDPLKDNVHLSKLEIFAVVARQTFFHFKSAYQRNSVNYIQ